MSGKISNQDVLNNRAFLQAECLTLTVSQSEGDFIGRDDKIIQAAVNYLLVKGGGVLNIAAGEYLFSNSLVPAENVLIKGSGEGTIFKKAADQIMA